jgi:CBS domain-containing protein
MSNLGCAGTPCITPLVAAAAMSMVVARTETETVSHFVAFSNVVNPLTIDENTSLEDVLALMGQVN